MTDPAIKNLLIVGVGLIGGSFSLALKSAGRVNHVMGYGRNRSNLEYAVREGVIDEIADSLEDAAARSDVIFLAVPVGAMKGVLERIEPVISDHCVITDGGSTKVEPVQVARAALKEKFKVFVPGHPIAGSEKSGAMAAKADLYERHKVLLTPVANQTDPQALEAVQDLWCACGASVEIMEPAEHDRVLAMTSHLPHALAFCLVDYIARGNDAKRCFDLAAGGFLDFTRIAGSDVSMWRDISLSNRDALIDGIDGFAAALNALRECISAGDREGIEQVFSNASSSRRALIDPRLCGDK